MDYITLREKWFGKLPLINNNIGSRHVRNNSDVIGCKCRGNTH